MKKSSADLTTVKKMDQIFVVVPRMIVIKKTEEFNARIGRQTEHDVILIHRCMFQGPSIPFLHSV